MDRTYDIVLFGATGFTGGLTAEYLAHRQQEQPFRWAIAGRNEEKLAGVAADLKQAVPAVEVDQITADSGDLVSLREMARRTAVVLTTVGPYDEYGELLVQACVREKTDYADITGEPDFVKRMMARYGDEARENGTRLVNCCGFDSIPHDYGVYYTVKQLPDEAAVTVRGYVSASGSFSGGTWRSAIKGMGKASLTGGGDKKKKAPRPATDRKVGSADLSIHRQPEIKGWACPMPTIDPQIILRSARTLPVYGRKFRYGHFVRVGSLPKLVGLVGGVGAVFALAQLPPTRNWLLGMRQSGEGPSEEKRAESKFRVAFLGETADGGRIKTEVRGGDPGYGETSKMVAESALALALHKDELPAVSGILTPVQAFGDYMLHRLQEVGIEFETIADR